MSTTEAITPQNVSKHIHALVQMNVNAKTLPSQELKGPRVYATINDEAGELVCVLVADVGAAGSTGASLSRIPAGAVQDLVRKGQELDDDLLANYHEIANVLTVLTTAAVGRRTILRKVEQSKGEPPEPLRALIKSAKNKVFLNVTLQGYPPGGLNFYHV